MRWNLSVAGLAASLGFISVIVAGVDPDASVLVFFRPSLAALPIGAASAALGPLGKVPTPVRALPPPC